MCTRDVFKEELGTSLLSTTLAYCRSAMNENQFVLRLVLTCFSQRCLDRKVVTISPPTHATAAPAGAVCLLRIRQPSELNKAEAEHGDGKALHTVCRRVKEKEVVNADVTKGAHEPDCQARPFRTSLCLRVVSLTSQQSSSRRETSGILLSKVPPNSTNTSRHSQTSMKQRRIHSRYPATSTRSASRTMLPRVWSPKDLDV